MKELLREALEISETDTIEDFIIDVLETYLDTQTDTPDYYLEVEPGKRAFIKKVDEGYKMLAGSYISEGTQESLQDHSYGILREKLIDDGIIVDHIFEEDYVGSSQSALASVAKGYPVNGKRAWLTIPSMGQGRKHGQGSRRGRGRARDCDEDQRGRREGSRHHMKSAGHREYRRKK